MSFPRRLKRQSACRSDPNLELTLLVTLFRTLALTPPRDENASSNDTGLQYRNTVDWFSLYDIGVALNHMYRICLFEIGRREIHASVDLAIRSDEQQLHKWADRT